MSEWTEGWLWGLASGMLVALCRDVLLGVGVWRQRCELSDGSCESRKKGKKR